RVQIMPSLLAGDFGNLEASAKKSEAAGADALHLDIMDGCFVPNISMGPDVVRMARRAVRIPLNVHLMIVRPDLYAQTFIEAGADTLLIQIESAGDILKTLRHIRKLGAKSGIVLNPETPPEAIASCLNEVDEILCMTVHPGFGGQSFMPEVLPKIKALRGICSDLFQKKGAKKLIDIAVDGGIDLKTVTSVAAAGANAIIAGNSLFKAKDMASDLRLMREKAERSLP
ncbi:MAG: ribulose-phosphate 3-epimerase, partial [Kiritimatiellia bacterium]|nr:ribulose-phosphate 3-epimerase [Kiritimatiellia bacterium]